MRIMKVQGKGKVFVPPDIVVINFEVEEQANDYAECLNKLNRRATSLRTDLKSVGRGKTKLKTTNFSIKVNQRYVDGHNVFDGYIGSHTLRIEFPADKNLLNEILGQISRGHSGAELELTFTVRDKESVKQAVLIDAVKTAQKNAHILAEAAGLRLGLIQQIDYGWTEIRFRDRTANILSCSEELPMSYAPDIEPEDIGAENYVTLVYEIME